MIETILVCGKFKSLAGEYFQANDSQVSQTVNYGIFDNILSVRDVKLVRIGEFSHNPSASGANLVLA